MISEDNNIIPLINDIIYMCFQFAFVFLSFLSYPSPLVLESRKFKGSKELTFTVTITVILGLSKHLPVCTTRDSCFRYAHLWSTALFFRDCATPAKLPTCNYHVINFTLSRTILWAAVFQVRLSSRLFYTSRTIQPAN